MELKMFISGQLVDVTPINFTKLHEPGYVDHLKSELEEKNEDIIDLSRQEPEFFIDTLPSRMNEKKKFPLKN